MGKADDAALIEAAFENRPAGVRRALAAGARVDAKSAPPDGGRTALMYAAMNGSLPLVRLLLRAGANARAADRHGDTALHFACSHAVDEPVVRALLEAGADPNAHGFCGNTPLHGAADRQRAWLIKLLLAHGADPAARNKVAPGKRPADYARKASLKKLLAPPRR